jgi:CheY-like chemotaxis protein/Tfp pilus assembly protein PilZ
MAEASAQNAALKSGDREKRLLLVVDGDNAHLYYTSMLLQRLEYNIHTAKTAEDALEIMGVAHPALVLTEIALGGMDGVELLKKIKRNPQTFSVPVIILTASKDQAVKAAGTQEGCAAYLQKPVEPDVLYAAIQKATESQPRQYIRLNTTLNVIVGDDKIAEYTGSGDYITALSEHGMYISTAKPKPIGLQIPITILLEDMKIKVEGMVLYSFQRGQGPLRTPGMGIKFVRISPEDQKVIKVYIKREITKGLTMAHIGGTVF